MVDHGLVIRRHELADADWEFVRPLLPESLRGRKRLDDRRVLNGIVWKSRTGTGLARCVRAVRPVADAAHPLSPLGPGRHVRADAPGAGDIDWQVSVDSTVVRPHQHAAGARKGGSAAPVSDVPRAPPP
ncbi:transposase [Streptomyces sp. S.PB5]|uniref:transposase n=1 Tax=Streptomyces sp. S.PB5 TaxID=3020844 RepID=UPI00339D4A03